MDVERFEIPNWSKHEQQQNHDEKAKKSFVSLKMSHQVIRLSNVITIEQCT